MNEGEEEDEKVYTKAQKGRKDVKNKEKNLKVLHFIAQKNFSSLIFFCCILKQLEMFPSVPSGFFIYTCTVSNSFFQTTKKN